ncbi:alpha/beta hydrolase [Gracilibacillus alcaliphilus]|uniref:alpha/beta hydrolase n=1 Tax=Gracilibacillus alcaliphilus TaxID=1401441 RepID=UPI00195A17B9|nr:alpha/beta hydrolase [Gracilibacillus alcaliphilus]MBM7675953.1 alpha-beta hydrolase superfamily lysophospholipase [Gracilibacillus alcaliphilus]
MPEHSFWVPVRDSCRLYLKAWLPASQPVAIVQIAHGMAEHIERYHDFAAFLNSQGIIVYGHDHRGHGKTGKETNSLGFFADEDGFQTVVHDCLEITEYIKTQHPEGLPLFLLGHSMGSFISRNYIIESSDEIDGVILVGSGSQSKTLLTIGKQLAKWLGKVEGKDKQSTLMHKLSFSGYNKRTEKRTANDWLSTDLEQVNRYQADPLCGFIPSNQFFYDLYTGIEKMQSKSLASQIRKDLPMLFISGKDDPVGQYGKGIHTAVTFYQSLGMENIDYRLYDSGRHEILNEKDKNHVFQDIILWIFKQKSCQKSTLSL